MSEDAEPAPSPPAAQRSRKLARTVTALAVLPLILPFPLWGLELLWIVPLYRQAWQQCQNFGCPAAVDWDRLGFLLVLGPSIFIALISALLGIIGLVRARWHPTSSENKNYFAASVFCGGVWAVIFASILCSVYPSLSTWPTWKAEKQLMS